MGVLLSTIGVSEPKLSLQPPKVVVGTIHGTQITLAYVMNLILSIFDSSETHGSTPMYKTFSNKLVNKNTKCDDQFVLMIILLEFGVIPTVKQGFYCGDLLISHKYRGDTISPEVLGVTAALLPVIMVICTELLAHQSFKKINLYAIVFYISECLVGAILTLLVTSVAKVIVGEPRPHFFDICQPDTAKNCTLGQFIETYTCMSKEFSYLNVIDASLSFPSGHSSISWFVGIFSSYVIHSRTTTVNAGYIARPFLISVCLSWSLLCSLSRITDRRHHWWDVLAGGTLGVVFALYTIKVVHEKLRDNSSLVCSICLERQIPLSENKQQNSNGISNHL